MSSEYGFVYCLQNYAMPGLWKVGCTGSSPNQRAADLSRATGIPHPFEVVGYIEIRDYQRWERKFHRALARFRENNKREFFACDVSDIAPLFVFNEDACAFVDIDFAPQLGPDRFAALVNPYAADGSLESD